MASFLARLFWMPLVAKPARRVLLSWHDGRLLLSQGVHHLLIQLEVRLDEFGRCQRQPLVERNISKIAAPEYLQKPQRYGVGILDVVPPSKGYVADVAGMEENIACVNMRLKAGVFASCIGTRPPSGPKLLLPPDLPSTGVSRPLCRRQRPKRGESRV